MKNKLELSASSGVVKTTLLAQINNVFIETTHDFDFVIWATVPKTVIKSWKGS